jgi:hypothetical protein
VHIQFNQATDELQVINNLPQPLTDAVAHVSIYHLDGSVAHEYDVKVTAPPDVATNLGPVEFPPNLTSTHFIKLDLRDAQGKLISSNFYWRGQPGYPDVLSDLNTMPAVTLQAQAESKDADGKRLVTVTLHNPTTNISLMTHLQLRRQHSGERVLPVFYSDNYVSLAPNETKTITVEAASKDLNGEGALVVFDGWNVTVAPASFAGVSVAPNLEAQPDNSPATGLPFQTTGLR